MITRELTNIGQPFLTVNNEPVGGVRIRFIIVDTDSQSPTDVFDETTHEQILPLCIETMSGSNGVFSVNLWPTDRAENVMYRATIIGVTGVRTFVRPLPSGGDPLTWFEFITGAEISVDTVTLDNNFILDESQIL